VRKRTTPQHGQPHVRRSRGRGGRAELCGLRRCRFHPQPEPDVWRISAVAAAGRSDLTAAVGAAAASGTQCDHFRVRFAMLKSKVGQRKEQSSKQRNRRDRTARSSCVQKYDRQYAIRN
jgi:hypothetical protein